MTIGPPRGEYGRSRLLENEIADDPLDQFLAWMKDAEAAGIREPHAMALATADASGAPTVRMVLLKGLDASGFAFFTNRSSRKGRDLAANSRAALLFFWAELERQVRVEGTVEAIDDASADAYFASRPRRSQIAASVSRQSDVVAGRDALEAAFRRLEADLEGAPVPRPPEWGGYRLIPAALEFWQGRRDRLHDRLRFTRAPGAAWVLERLFP